MERELTGKTAFVTGASRGIGEAIARRFAAEGATVVIAARTLEPGTGTFADGAAFAAGPSKVAGSLQEVVARIIADGGNAIAIQCDMAKPESRAQAVDEALAAVGRIDILVNNAAAGGYGYRWDQISGELFDRVVETNLKGPLDLMQRLAPPMIARGSGWIVNVISNLAERPIKPFKASDEGGTLLYGISQAAMIRLTAGCAAELNGTGVCVNALGPVGVVFTPGAAALGAGQYRNLPDWIEEPIEAMAEAALSLAACDADAVNGTVVYTTDYLQELGREIRTLDGKTVLEPWKSPVEGA